MNRIRAIVFIAIFVVGVTVIAGIATVSISPAAGRAVYGGTIALLAGKYWQQRRITREVVEGLAEIRRIIKGDEPIHHDHDGNEI